MMHLYVASQLVKVIDFFMYLLSKGRFESPASFEKLVYTTFGKTGRILGPALCCCCIVIICKSYRKSTFCRIYFIIFQHNTIHIKVLLNNNTIFENHFSKNSYLYLGLKQYIRFHVEDLYQDINSRNSNATKFEDIHYNFDKLPYPRK